MPGPKNAGISGDGFRWYEWAPPDVEPTAVLSVTSIQKLCGESYQLVNWQLTNLLNVAMGTTKRRKVGPRGGISDIYVPDGPFPGEFIRRMIASEGKQTALDELRSWVRDAADKPRDTAAVCGTIVHESIELGIKTDRIDRLYVEAAVDRLSSRDQARVKKHGGVTEDDINFVRRCNGQYWHMRETEPFVILAREPQVWNLTAGYAGSADVLLWFLPDGTSDEERARWQAKANFITQSMIEAVGGHVVLGDWKTSKGIYTEQVIQVHAYLAAEFVGADGVIDQRLTDILSKSSRALLVHIRPDGWVLDYVDFEAGPLRAFLGSVARARFLAQFPDPEPLFTHVKKGAMPETERDVDAA